MKEDQLALSIFSTAVQVLDVLQRVYMRVITSVGPETRSSTAFGSILQCNSHDFVQRRIRFFGIFEHNLTYYSLGKIKKGDIYLDIGANVGYFTLLASQCVGLEGKVISIEADPKTFEKLLYNIKINSCQNVYARNVAATATSCYVNIERTEPNNSGSNSIVIGSDKNGIQGVPFKEIVADDIKRVRFIKIDIEGSEAPILNAIIDSLSELPDDLVIASEISPLSAEYIALFLKSGFRVYAIQNIYTIDYYLMRAYLRRYNEDNVVHKIEITQYNPMYRDYIFERITPKVAN